MRGYLHWKDMEEINALEVQGFVGMPCKPPRLLDISRQKSPTCQPCHGDVCN